MCTHWQLDSSLLSALYLVLSQLVAAGSHSLVGKGTWLEWENVVVLLVGNKLNQGWVERCRRLFLRVVVEGSHIHYIEADFQLSPH